MSNFLFSMKKLFLLLAAIVTLAMSASAQNRTYQGMVLSSADNEPLIGATVKPIGGGQGCATNANGQFTLTVPASVKEITVTYIGMKPATVALSQGMRVYLDNSTQLLDQVVVTGYGSGKKLGSVVGSVAVVGEQVFENTPTANFVDALQGQVAGLAINSGSGDPSSTTNSIVLRGTNSLTQDVTPLFIMDGAPVSAGLFNSLNPADIENITVLKDAASIAIYGSRGANGIILITTKKGKFGAKAKATIRASYGWSSVVSDKVDMMNSQQYMQFRDIIGQPLTDNVKNLINNYGISTDWRKEMFSESAPTYSIDATVQGGSDNLSYYISLAHFDQKGIIENSHLRRETLSFNLDSKVNDWLRVGLSGNIAYRKSKTNYEDEYRAAGKGLTLNNPMVLARMAFPYDSPYAYSFNENGDIVYGNRIEKIHYSGITMPWYTYTYDHYSNNNISGNLRLFEQITPIKGLVIKAQQAMEAYDSRTTDIVDPRATFYTAMGDKIGSNDVGFINQGSNSESFARSYQMTYTNTAEYTFDVAEKHHGRVLVGQETIIDRYNGFGVATSGTSDVRMNLLDQGTTVTMNGVSYSKGEQIINSYFLNGNYDYDNRYFFDFSVRRDGNSAFAPENHWSTFGAFGVMWNLRNEPYLPLKDLTWLNDLRLHYSYGATGNANIGNFEWQGIVGTLTPGYAGEPSTGIGGASNYNLSWETVYSHNVGFNFRVFDRLTINADWYLKRTEDMLYDIPYSLTVGSSSGMGNVCSMTNQGIEVDVQADIYKDKDWYVGARVGFNYNKNQIESLWDGATEFARAGYGYIQRVGDVCDQYYMVRYVGVDPADGKQMWLDKNDNVTKVFPSDAQVGTGKSINAPWTGGFGLNARWKGLSASANFVWQSGKYMLNNDNYFIRNSAMGTSYNQCVDMLNIWTTPGQVTDIPAFGEAITRAGEDTRSLENASFMRMKNLTVAYDLPKSILNKLGIEALQFHFTGRNLWTLTSSDFTGADPEIPSNYIQFQYPNTRQYEFGLEVTF